MRSNIFRLAGHNVDITTEGEYIPNSLQTYLTNANASITVTVSEQDIAYEATVTPLLDPSPKTLTSFAIQRKLSEALIDYDTILFHASALAVDGQGYLFAALSGTGKSTHARLWREMYGDRVTMINDDKPFIHVGEDEVRVYGSPWDGKHHLSTNTSVPVKAICILTRDTTNHIERIDVDEAFAILYQQTYRSKDPLKLAHTIDLLNRMAGKVALYRLGCNMDPDAARVSYEGMNDE